ncbi:DNA polymerase V family protein [Saliphagus infecundisoli]|uniref:DNA polymerase V family protein n=1 Tax=Saliphagus infecundisoli TaxID=1849069 RepID=A0ABD5Q990_9EURY|nr:DNA polymerase V family protein [Saliphagus infecundisoli]
MTDPETTTRRNWILGVGSLTILSGTVGCLGLGDDDEEAGEPENETDGNGSENTSTQPDGERKEITDTESPDDNQSNDTGSDDDEGSESDDNDDSILEEEPNDDESDDDDENDSEGDQADLDNEPDDNETDTEEENDTAEESQENLDNDSTDNSSTESSDDENDSESNQNESEEEREFEQIIIEALSYQVDYPADWEMVETDESIPVIIANSNETAWLWIDIRETSLDLEGDVTNYRQNFEPNPGFEIHEDEPMTLTSGEDGHRFVIEVTESPENPLFAHELLVNEHGNEYLTSVQVSRPEYDEEYAELAEEILASVTLR